MSEEATTPEAPTEVKTQEAENAAPDLSLNQFLTGDLQGNETLSRFKDVPGLASSYLELRQKMGNAVVPPSKDASPEDIKKYHQALGVPENPSDYGIKHDAFEELPLSEELVTGFMEAGHKAGATPEVMEALFNWYGQSQLEQSKADIELVNKAHAEQDALLKQEWAGEYDANMATIGAVVKNIFSEETMAELEETRMGDNVGFMKDMLALAQKMGEKSIAGTTGGGVQPIVTPISLKEEAKKLQREPDYWTSATKQARVAEIFKQISQLQGK